MNPFAFLCVSLCVLCVEAGVGGAASGRAVTHARQDAAPPGVATNSSLVTRHSSLPKVWMSVTWREPAEETIRMCAEQGVDAILVPTGSQELCANVLQLLRKHHVKGFTRLKSEPSESVPSGVKDGQPFERAVFIGGAYRGKAIDRTLFSFEPKAYDIVVEPPVYSRRQGYKSVVKGADGKEVVVKSGHYFSSYVPLDKAEIIVPEKPFDGEPHVRIIPCEVLPAEPGMKPENDTATSDMTGPEIENRRLVRLKFDLSDCAGMMLDKVGIAVYWASDTEGASWKQGRGQLSVFSEHTRNAARASGALLANRWALANGGTFPSDDIVAIRFGDECFNLTGWIDCEAASFPLWGFSESGRAAFREVSGFGFQVSGSATNSSLVTRHSSLVRGTTLVAPRTWGHPEIYGAEAYGIALYSYHKACAELTRAFVEGVRSVSPSLKVFRNTTRGNVWSEQNDHDGSGQELLARELDFIHLDPYPLGETYNEETIPFDMGYMSGLARRLGKPIIPWMQAHSYAPCGLGNVTPADMKRMWAQHFPFSPDGMMWLGFDLKPGKTGTEMTFPHGSPESWAYAKELFASMHNAQCTMHNGTDTNSSLVTRHSSLTMASGAAAPLAIVRPYVTRAICCAQGAGHEAWRNPADRILEAYVKAWSLDNGLLYDVFELPPEASMHTDAANSSLVSHSSLVTRHSSLPPALADELKKYRSIVSTIPIPGIANVRVLGEGTEGTVMTEDEISALRKKFAAEIAELKAKGATLPPSAAAVR